MNTKLTDIYYHFLLLFSLKERISFEAEQYLQEELKDIKAKELIELAELIRSKSSSFICATEAQRQFLSDQMNRFSHSISLLGLCTFHPSGYVREEALLKLSQFRTGEELTFMLIRLNDWVPTIRQLAKKEVLARIPSSFYLSFEDYIEFINRLRSWTRGNHEEVLKIFEEALIRDDNKERLYQALQHPHFRIRRLAVRLATQKATAFLDLFSFVKRDKDPLIRLLYLSNMANVVDHSQLISFVEFFKNDPYFQIRKKAFYLAIDHELSQAHDIALQAFFDSHFSMRDLARWYLTKQGKAQTDLQEISRGELINYPYKIGAILSIGEVGSESDALPLLPLLDHKRAKMRHAAVVAISKLHPLLLKERALDKFKKETPSIAVLYKNLIKQHPDWYTLNDLWNLFRLNPSLLKKLQEWDRLLYLLKANQKEPVSWLYTFGYIDGSGPRYRYALSPTLQEISQIQEALDKSSFDPSLIQKMKSWLKNISSQ